VPLAQPPRLVTGRALVERGDVAALGCAGGRRVQGLHARILPRRSAARILISAARAC
jgi:hypothetical protein